MEIKAVVKAAGETHSTGIRPHPYRLTPVYKQRINGKVTQIPLSREASVCFQKELVERSMVYSPSNVPTSNIPRNSDMALTLLLVRTLLPLLVGHHFLLLKVYAIQSAQSASHP